MICELLSHICDYVDSECSLDLNPKPTLNSIHYSNVKLESLSENTRLRSIGKLRTYKDLNK